MNRDNAAKVKGRLVWLCFNQPAQLLSWLLSWVEDLMATDFKDLNAPGLQLLSQ